MGVLPNTTGGLQNILPAFIDLQCWSFTCGGAAGSILGVQIGPKKQRPRPLPNPHISDALRHFKGEFGLLIYCRWKLRRFENVTLTDADVDSQTGTFNSALRAAEGASIKGYTLSDNFDLSFDFDDGSLEILCSQPPFSERNYNVYFPLGSLAV